MINNIKGGFSNTWKLAFALPTLFSAALFVSSTNAIAQSRSVKTEVVDNSEKAKQNTVKKDDANDLIKDLISERILTGKEKNLFVKLNYEELIVNSKTMPENLHKRMREKYMAGNPRKTITYKVSAD